jgi:putative transposase
MGQWRRTQRYAAIRRIDEDALAEAIVALASEYGRYGYRRITAVLQDGGWQVGMCWFSLKWKEGALR